MKKIYIACALLTFLSINGSYQDIIINNSITSNGGNASGDKRYNYIKPFLHKFKRPFTVLDIGAAQGYFSLRTAYDYKKSVAVMIEGGYIWSPNTVQKDTNLLLDICQKNSALKNIIFLNQQVTLDEFKKLSDCEHFDVVYALNVLHHMKGINDINTMKEIVDTVLNLGNIVFIELPSYAPKELINYVNLRVPHILFQYDRPNKAIGTLRLHQNKKDKISVKAYGAKKEDGVKYSIISDFVNKKLIKIDRLGKKKETSWEPGINLYTFKMLNGVWPNKNFLLSMIDKKIKNIKNFLFPHDIIIQGKNIIVRKNSSNKPKDSINQFLNIFKN